MAEEHRKCNGGEEDGGGRGTSNGGRSSKKQKEKMPPQRGPGIAELERLRLEEKQQERLRLAEKQVQKLAALIHPSLLPSNYFYPSASQPDFRVESEFNPPGSFSRHIPSAQNMYLAPTDPVPSQSTSNYRDYNFVMGAQGMIQEAWTHRPPLMGNASSASLSLQSHPFELPSNQSQYYSSYAPFIPQGEKVPAGGAKRSYPFSLENPPAALPPFKIHKAGTPIMNGPEEPSSFRETDNIGSTRPVVDPATVNAVWNNWSHSRPPAYGASTSYNPSPGYMFQQYSQGYTTALAHMQAALGWTDQRPLQQPYYNLPPPTIPPNNVKNTDTNGVRSEDINGIRKGDTNGASKEDTNGGSNEDTNGASKEGTPETIDLTLKL